jgi:hypothetical protein
VRRTFQILPNSRRGPPTAAETGTAQVTQTDKERRAAEKATAEQASSEVRDFLRALIEFVWAHGRGFADQLPLHEDEKDFLDQQEAGLVRAQVELDRAVSLIASPRLRREVYHSVWKLLWHGAHMARFARPPDAIERARALEEEERRRQEAIRRGKASGAKRNADAAARWRKRVLRLAQQLRADDRSTSKKALATWIEDHWKETEGFLPTYDTLIEFLRRCEKNESLPRKIARRKLSPSGRDS